MKPKTVERALLIALGISLLWLNAAAKKPTPTPDPGKKSGVKASEKAKPTKTPKATATPSKKKSVKKKTPTPTPTPVEEMEDGSEYEEEAEGEAASEEPEKLTVQEISRRVDESQASMKDVTMELKMEAKDALSGTKQQVRGLVKMKGPGNVYVHYTHPMEQFLFIRQGLVQMYQPAQNMVYRQKMEGSGRGGEPVYIGVGQELKQYMAVSRVSVVKDTPEDVTLLFVPKDSEAMFERMKVTIYKDTWWPYKIEMQAPSVETKATFQKFKFNQGVEDSVFEFTPPDDAQIVEGAVF